LRIAAKARPAEAAELVAIVDAIEPYQESAGRLEKYRVAPQVCNLYSLHKKREMLARFFRVSHNRSVVFEPLPAVFPGHVAPVVREDADGERQIVLMSWGFVLLQKDRAPRRVTNVRDDKILESRFWRGSLRNDAVGRQPHPSASPMATSSGDLALVGLRRSGERPCLPLLGSGDVTRGPVRKDGPKLNLDVYVFLRKRRNSRPGLAARHKKPLH
jgi:hypothetical protein